MWACMPQAGIDPPRQSHATYEASHHDWIYHLIFAIQFLAKYIMPLKLRCAKCCLSFLTMLRPGLSPHWGDAFKTDFKNLSDDCDAFHLAPCGIENVTTRRTVVDVGAFSRDSRRAISRVSGMSKDFLSTGLRECFKIPPGSKLMAGWQQAF